MVRVTQGRLFLPTSDASFGMAPASAQVNDSVCIMDDGQVTYLVRKMDDRYYTSYYTFIGECFFQGAMDGEALEWDDL